MLRFEQEAISVVAFCYLTDIKIRLDCGAFKDGDSMSELREEKRTLHALRKHIDALLASGAVITQRDPLTLLDGGQVLRVKHGMLIAYYKSLALIEPTTDGEWPESLREMAADLCCRQLDDAIEAELENNPQRSAALRSSKARRTDG